jgi:hypothetical protein
MLDTVPSTMKLAAGDQQTFESSLAAIGRAAINAKSPTIARYEIGFQVLDQDDDNTRAAGVFGYKLGNRMLYVPMFYRDGITKGTGQLRDPKRKMAVPLSDNWVNKIISDSGAEEEATAVPRSTISGSTSPSLWQLKYSPTKWAGDRSWVEAARKDLAAALIDGGPGAPADIDLVKVAAEFPAVMAGLDRMVADYPWFAKALTDFHGTTKVAAALEAAQKTADRPLRVPAPRVKAAARRLTVIRVSEYASRPVSRSKALDFDKDQLGDLMSGNNAYSDRRSDDEVSSVVLRWDDKDTPGNVFENPDGSGLYRVMCADGEFRVCAVLDDLVGWSAYSVPSPGRCMVISTEDGKWTEADRNSVWVAGGAESPSVVADWFAGLKDVAPERTESQVMVVRLKDGGVVQGSTLFSVCCDAIMSCGTHGTRRSSWAESATLSPVRWTDDTSGSPLKIRITKYVDGLTVRSNCLYVPDDDRVKFVPMTRADGCLRLAAGDDLDHLLCPGVKAASDAGARLIKIAHAAGRFSVAAGSDSIPATATVDRNEFEAHLVERLAMRPKEARDVVRAAARAGTTSVLLAGPIKAAAPGNYEDTRYRVPTDWPNAPTVTDEQLVQSAGFADDVVPSEIASELRVPIEDLGQQPGTNIAARPYPQEEGLDVPLHGIGNSGDSGLRLSPREVDTVAAAARSGSRELFDTTSLAVLVKRTKLDSVITKVTKAATRWMNEAADCLCHLAWNADEWAERFGKHEIGPLEDQLSDHFDGVGDLALSLQEKAVDGGRDFGILPKIDTVDAGAAGGA